MNELPWTWDCGECGERINVAEDVSDEHSIACSLHPANRPGHDDHD